MTRVAFFPSQNPVNPYIANLTSALAREGVEFCPAPAHLTQAWVRQNRGQIDILHFNWPNYFYAAPQLKDAVDGALLFLRCASLAKDYGYKIVWTVHNVFGHDVEQREVDQLVSVALARMADALIVHCQCARDRIRQFFDRTGDDIFYAPHGNYIQSYPNTISRAEARAALGFGQEEFIYLFFGYVRPYKGVARLVEVFRSLPNQQARLIIAGHPHPTSYVAELRDRAGDDGRIRLDTRLVPVPDVQVYLNAADVVVLPFDSILTSGSLILALSFGRPVIAPAVGAIPELVSVEPGREIGVLYDPWQPAGLMGALTAAGNGFPAEAAGRRAYQTALTLDWPPIARRIAEVYEYARTR